MKINHRFIPKISIIVLLIMASFFGVLQLKQGKKLKSQEVVISQLKQRLNAQNSLLKTDSLLVEGRYQDAFEMYKNQEMGTIEDGEVGVGLRLAIAQKFLEFENELATKASMANVKEDTIDIKESANQNPKIDQLDSLNFVLSKTKMQLAKMKRQLYQKSFGEYLTFTNSKGSEVHYVGQVQDGKANGYGVAILNTGSRYVGEWKNNQRHGQGVFYWKDGEYYEGNYEGDKRNGQGTYFWPNGEKYVGQWKDDLRSGKGAFFGKDGKLMTKGIWEDDKMITDTTKPKKQRSKEKDVAAL